MNVNRFAVSLENFECANRRRVLIVDDETRYRFLISTSLSIRNYETLTVRTASDALALAAREHLDLVLLDTDLPDRAGYEVCERICAFSQVPIVMLPASDKIEDIVKCLDAGADDCVPKPFTIEELLTRIRAVLKGVSNCRRPCPDVRSGYP